MQGMQSGRNGDPGASLLPDIAAERFEAAAWADLVAAAPPAAAAQAGIAVVAFDGVTLCTAPGLPSPEFNRAVGVGADGADPPEATLDAVISGLRAGAPGTSVVQVVDRPENAGLLTRLAARGLTRTLRPWVVLTRAADAIPPAPTRLAVRRIGPPEAAAAGRVFSRGYGLPSFFDDWAAALVGRPGWSACAAFDGPDMVAVAFLFRRGGRAMLGGAATLPAARGRGAQRALMRLRLKEARAAGATVVQTHTGLPVGDGRNPSLDNMLAMGFRPAHVRRNLLLPARTGGA